MGVAEIDDAKAAATARIMTEEKCIVCNSEDLVWDLIILKEIVGRRLAFMC